MNLCLLFRKAANENYCRMQKSFPFFFYYWISYYYEILLVTLRWRCVCAISECGHSFILIKRGKQQTSTNTLIAYSLTDFKKSCLATCEFFGQWCNQMNEQIKLTLDKEIIVYWNIKQLNNVVFNFITEMRNTIFI